MHIQALELHTNREAAFSFLYDLYKLRKMSEETLECHCINLHLQLNSNLHKTDLYEELNLYRKIVSQESLALNVRKFIFQNNIKNFSQYCHSL